MITKRARKGTEIPARKATAGPSGKALKMKPPRFAGTGRDRLTQEQRSRVMAAVKGKGTKPEAAVEALLAKRGIAFRTQARDLPGSPDFAIDGAKVAVLVDGDFWHGYRFSVTKVKLSEHWRKKIASNIRRDVRNRRLLREAGWTVVRLWEHSVKKAPARCARRVLAAIETGNQAAALIDDDSTDATQSATTRASRQGTALPT